MGATLLFDRYRLVAPAGRGGTAEVWRAVDARSGEPVAVKRLHPVVFGSRLGRERLLREFRALRGLRHPNVVRIRDLELTESDAALILDFVDGPSLRERLAAGPLPLDEAVTIAADVGAGLAAAHGVGIVHRDVTPGNVLIGADGRARLTDFGIARHDSETAGMTSTGMVVGTLRYLAPEQLRGEPATPSSDLFSLAAVTYEMLAGRPAYIATTPVALVEAQRESPPPIEGIPSALDAAVRRNLAADPADRQPGVAAFADALRAATGAQDEVTRAVPVVVAPPPTGATVARSSRPAMAGLALAGALGLALVAGAAFDGWTPGDAGAVERTPGTSAAPTPAPTEAPAVEVDRDEGDDGEGNGEGRGKGKGKDGGGKDDGGGKGKGRDGGDDD